MKAQKQPARMYMDCGPTGFQILALSYDCPERGWGTHSRYTKEGSIAGLPGIGGKFGICYLRDVSEGRHR
jgi:hypothetical protein